MLCFIFAWTAWSILNGVLAFKQDIHRVCRLKWCLSRRNFEALSRNSEMRQSASSCLPVRLSVLPSARSNLHPIGRIFMKLYIWVFFDNLSRKFELHLNLTRVTGTLHEDLCTRTISVSVLLRTRNISDKCHGEDQNTRFMYNPVFPKIVVFFF